MMLTGQTETEQYDAFICYSRKDIDFARRLEKALEAYKPPRDLKAPPRYLQVFRDEGDLTGVEYSQSIERHIQNSAKLMVICSPAARQSQYVNDEIRRFAQAKGAENIIPLIVSGIPNNEAKPEQTADLAFPEALCEVLKMPLAVSYLGFDPAKDKVDRGDYSNSWYTLLANLYNLSRTEIERRDLKRRLRRRNIAIAIVSSVMICLACLAAYAWIQKNEAVRQQKISEERGKVALSRQLAAQSEKLKELDFDLALILSIEAFEVANTPEANSALFTVLHDQPQIRTILKATSFALSPDGKIIASGSRDNTIRLWDISTSKLKPLAPPLIGHTDVVESVAFSPNGKFLVSGSSDKTIILWDSATSKPLTRFTGHQLRVSSLVLSPDGKILASASDDNTIRLWDMTTGQIREAPWIGHQCSVFSVAFSPDGKSLASGSSDKTIILWELDTGWPRRLPPGHESAVDRLAFSPDGRLLASVSSDNTLILWDMEKLQRQGSPLEKYETKMVTSMSFSPNGNNLATGRENGTLSIWDVKTCIPLGPPLKGHKGRIRSVAFTPDGNTLVSASGEETILWKVSGYSLIDIARQLCKRNLSEKEWRRYMGDRPYRKTCPNLPVPEEAKNAP